MKKYIESSGVYRALVNNSLSGMLEWVTLEKLLDYMEIEGIAIDDITWLHNCYKHLQQKRFIPIPNETYFTTYEKRLFIIAQSKYSRNIMVSFLSLDSPIFSWHRLVEDQMLLMQLHSIIQLKAKKDDQKEECKELLLVTGCIHA